jgi:acyl-CoA synthetase (AMP-forming)/AMP-acid ligase II
VHGRADDLIVTGGENVHPVEVERVLGAYPGVRAAGVFGLTDARWGQIVAAALVTGRDYPGDSALAEFLGSHLAPHKRPRRLCEIAALPLTAAGKLDRAALATVAKEMRPLRYGSEPAD